jgi:hypothetical protein
VHDEDELREVVTKMVLQEVKRSMDDHHWILLDHL